MTLSKEKSSMTDDQLKYPIGKFTPPAAYNSQDIHCWIESIKNISTKFRVTITELSEQQLDTPYREGGWTIRQIIHHLADAHIHNYIRFKLALTELNPIIKDWEETEWALLHDCQLPVEASLKILEGIDQRWSGLMEIFTSKEWDKSFIHPTSGETIPLKKALAIYSWHSEHHLAQIAKKIETLGLAFS